MSHPTCPTCEQAVPEKRLKYVQALHLAARAYYDELQGKDLVALEVSVRINREQVDRIGPETFWQL
jgi:hypothetical protein